MGQHYTKPATKGVDDIAGLRWWDGTQWQTLLGGPPTYAYIGSDAPTNPPNGMIWVQPIDPIVDLFSPDVLTEADSWAWVGFGYQWPGLSFIPEAQGMRLNWNPAPSQPGNGHQLGAAPFTGTAYANHQLLAQATVIVPLGAPDVRLAQAFTTSTAWITEKDVEVTVTLPIIWQDGMNKFIGIESQTDPGPGTSVLVRDIHLYDLTSSPPSPMRVWSETLNLWLPINDGLVQRAGDRMVGSLRFDTIDSAFGQPTVTGLPTPVDDTDAVPLGFLNDIINNLPQPVDPGGTGLIFSDTAPVDPETGLQWWDTSTPDVEPATVYVKSPAAGITNPTAAGWGMASWPTWAIEFPCNGLLTIQSSVLGRSTLASSVIGAHVAVVSMTDCVAEFVGGSPQSMNIGRFASNDIVTNDSSLNSMLTYKITGVPDGGVGTVEFGFEVYSNGAAGSANFRLGDATMQFTPYGDERITIIDLGAL